MFLHKIFAYIKKNVVTSYLGKPRTIITSNLRHALIFIDKNKESSELTFAKLSELQINR